MSRAAYVSADVHKWVIAYTSAIQVDGQTVAVLHYEHELGLYQHALDSNVPAGKHLLGVDKGGYILADSAKEPAVDEREKADKPSDYFQRFTLRRRPRCNGQDAGRRHQRRRHDHI